MSNIKAIEKYLFNADLGLSASIVAASEILFHEGEFRPIQFKDRKQEFINKLNSHFTNHMHEMFNHPENKESKAFFEKWHESLVNRVTETTTKVLNESNHQPDLRTMTKEVNQIFEDYGHYMRSDIK